VDASGAVYVADSHFVIETGIGHDRVVKVAFGAGVQTVLPFTGLDIPWGVAVDASGAVYVTDSRNNRVVKLQQ
jgi:serine/threonine protein kinase, bacterial